MTLGDGCESSLAFASVSRHTTTKEPSMRIAGSTLLAVVGSAIITITGCTSTAPPIARDSTRDDDVTANGAARDLDAPSLSQSRPTRPPGTAPLYTARPVSVPASTSTQAGSAMSIGYQGGPVMLGTPDVYFIWYGDWSGSAALTVLPDFMSNLGGSPYLKINSTYTDAQGRAVTGDVHYGGSTTDAYSRGKTLTQQSIEDVVASALASGALPTSSNAVYMVLTASDV